MPPVHEVPWQPYVATEAPESGRRRGVIIGASAAAAMAVAIGAISLTQGSSSSAATAAGAGFGPGAGDPTSQPNGQDVNAGGPLSGAPSSQSSGAFSPALATTNPPAVSTSSVVPPAPPTTVASAPKPPVVPPPSKPVVSCTGWHTTHVPAHDGSGNAIAGTFSMRSGPYDTCGPVGSFTSGQHMYIWCHAINGFGSTWVYGRIDNASAPGWQSLADLKPGAKLGPVC